MNTRNRLVTFRLSTGEYRQLEEMCTLSGSRSISEFARSAVLHRVEIGNGMKASLGEDLTTVTLRLRELDVTLRELSAWIGRVLGPEKAPEEAG